MSESLPAFDAAIVDLDGTMVDTVGDFEVALRLALADLGLPPVDRAFITRTVGKGSEHLLGSSLQHLGAPAHLYEQAWGRYQHHYLDINGQHSAVYAGVGEGLQALREAGLRLACLTNKPTRFALPLLAQKELDTYFELVFGVQRIPTFRAKEYVVRNTEVVEQSSRLENHAHFASG